MEGLEQRLKDEAQRRCWLWVLFGGGVGVLGGVLWIIVVIAVAALFLAGLGYWAKGYFPGAPPPMGTATARTLEWLPAVDRYGDGLPNNLDLAIIAQASGGQVYGDRYYCVDGSAEQSTGEACDTAYGKRWHTLGTAYGLTGVNAQDVRITKGTSRHAVAWNLATGLTRLTQTLRTDPTLKTALPAFHRATQAPPGWRVSGYADTIRTDLQTYGGPQMAAWAIAPWNRATGAYEDPSGATDWVLVAAGAPVGPGWTLEWRAPTVKDVTQTKPRKVQGQVQHPIKTKTQTVMVPQVMPHNLTGRQVEEPVAVYATLTTGRTVPLHLSTADPNVPVWPGGTLWGGPFNLHQIRSITAIWPGIPPVTETLPWPPVSGHAVGRVTSIPITAAVRHWWPAIQVASHQTGVPAGLIAAIMLHESGGQATAYNAQGPAYGLMQLLPSTAAGLPGYAADWQVNGPRNLLLGAQLLAADYRDTGQDSWRAAVAAYYGGLHTMEADGYRPGMPWAEAAPLLHRVPAAWAGNTQTLAAYADQMMAAARIMAQRAHEHPTVMARTRRTRVGKE